MRLATTPPKGAGKSRGATKTDALLRAIEGLGTDRNMNPIGIRTRALAEKTGIPPTSISVLLAPHVASGRLWVCKVTIPGSPPQNEYRKGSGGVVVPPAPLNTRRAGIAHGPATKPLAVTRLAPALSTAPAPGAAPAVPVFIAREQRGQPQPAVGNTGSSRAADPPCAAAPAVAAKATPKPTTGDALKKEPAARKASAGDDTKTSDEDLLLSIDQDGALQVGYGDDPARWIFGPRHVLALGDFLDATQGLWRP